MLESTRRIVTMALSCDGGAYLGQDEARAEQASAVGQRCIDPRESLLMSGVSWVVESHPDTGVDDGHRSG